MSFGEKFADVDAESKMHQKVTTKTKLFPTHKVMILVDDNALSPNLCLV
jgi:hypothetical protein